MKRARRQRIFGLALPIIGGMTSQNVFNLVDTAMVGVLGNAALAAVGIGSFATFTCLALILGIATGVQATAARRKGEGRHAETAVALNAGLLLVLAVGPLWSALLYWLVPRVYPYLQSDPQVIALGVPYLQIRVLGICFVGMNFAFRAYWNATDFSRLYMTTLVVMNLCNIALNYVLIFGRLGAPALGVRGAALANVLSMGVGTAIYCTLGLRHARVAGFLRQRPTAAVLGSLMRLSLPSGVQQLFFHGGSLAMYWIVGRIGTPELAAANVLINVMLVALLPGLGFGLAAATLVSQALGRRDPDDAERWAWDVARISAQVLAVLGLPMWLAPDLVLSAFIHDPTALELARLPMRLVGLTIAVEGVGLTLMQALLGAGDVRRVMFVAVSAQWLAFLPLAYLCGPVLGYGLLGVWLLQGAYRVAQALVYWRFWAGRAWTGRNV